MAKITLTSKIVNDKYTQYVYDKYDIQNREETTTVVPMIKVSELDSFDWQIGVIVGRSGAGKSTILNQLYKDFRPYKEIETDYTKCIVSQFPHMEEADVCDLLYGIGLSSVPTWLHKPQELSNGERARFEIVKQIANTEEGGVVYIDEYTSVVNRDVATSMSFALQRYIRKHNIKVVIASCHYDIIEWLTPDWVYNLNKQVDGDCELEHIIYANDKDYNVYSQLEKREVLSEAKMI